MVHQAQGQLVQEVAADGGLRAPPSRYVVKKEKDRPTVLAQAQPTELLIPTVDVSLLADADPAEDEKLLSTLQSWGLFAVTGHRMPEPFLDATLGSARGFFHLPTDAKQEYSNVVDGGRKFQPEGYGVDRVDTDEQVLDWCDRLYLQVLPEDERQLRFWPAHPPDLGELLHEFSLQSEKVARHVLAAMARSLGFEEGFFADKLGERMPSYARFTFTYYPPCPRPDLVNGLKPHTDKTVVSVILLDEHGGGLQVLKDGSWVDVPVLGRGRHQLLVVVGDEMEIMSNAAFRAPMHRVVAPGKAAERVSRAVFYQAVPHKVLEPSPELVGRERPAMYRRLEAKVFTDGFWDAFARGERTIDFLKVKVDLAGDQPAATAVSRSRSCRVELKWKRSTCAIRKLHR